MKSASYRRHVLAIVCLLASTGASVGPSFAQGVPDDFARALQNIAGALAASSAHRPTPPGQQPMADAGPSFDCHRARAAAAVTICTHADLAALDRTMAIRYAAALTGNPDHTGRLVTEQRRFLARRNACGDSPPCLRQAMLDQIAALDQEASQGTGAPPVTPAAATAAAAAAPAAPVSATLAEPVPCHPPLPNGSRFVCFTQNLKDLDARMVSTVGTILQSPTMPRDFEASQRAWMAERDKCTNDNCISARYRERLAEIAAFVPAQGAPDLVDSQTAEKNRRIAVEWSIPLLRGRLYLPAPELEPIQYSLNKIPAMTAWRKFMLTLGLADEPDLLKKYNDSSLNLVACTLLDEASQKQLGGEGICRNRSGISTNKSRDQYTIDGSANRLFVGAEFASRDFARRFAAERLPGIVASAPKLPLEIIMVQEAHVGSYDLKRGQFPIQPMYGKELRPTAFGSTTDVVLKNLTWPVSEDEARAFTAKIQTKSDSKAFIAIPMTIFRSVPENYSKDNGLPSGHQWQLEVGTVSLYDDARLTHRLYTFPDQDRLPRVIADTGAAAVPRYSAVPLDSETMMMLLLKAGAVSPDKVKWADAAYSRYDQEQSIKIRTDWKRVDPWGLWFTGNPASDPSLVARYKDWTLRRAMSLPDEVVLRQSYLAPGPGGWQALGMETISSPGPQVLDALRKIGGGSTNLLRDPPRIQANTGAIQVATPLPTRAYIVPTGQTPSGYAIPVLETVLRLGTVETIAGTTLLHVTPLSATLRQGDAVLSQVTFPSPAEQDRAAAATAQSTAEATQRADQAKIDAANAATAATARAAAERETARAAADSAVRAAASAYLGGTVSGPDVLGLRLGMSLEEADAAAHRAITVGWVLENTDHPTNFDAIDHLRIYVSPDKKETLALVLPHAGQPQHVIGIERIVSVEPTVSDASIWELLRKKYGTPTLTDERNRQLIWGNLNQTKGSCDLYVSIAHDLKMISGPPVPPADLLRFPNLTMRTPVGGPNVTDIGAWADCRPVLRATRGNDYVSTSLWDMRALVAVQTTTPAATASGAGTASPAIRF
jgi:uncharacterized protein